MAKTRSFPRLLLVLPCLLLTLMWCTAALASSTFTIDQSYGPLLYGDTDNNVVVTVLDDEHFAITAVVKSGDRLVGIPGATVTITSPKHPEPISQITDNRTGAAVFTFADFAETKGENATEYFYGSLDVTKPGYKSYHVDKFYFKGGLNRNVDFTNPNNDPYLCQFTYNGFDLLQNGYTLSVSKANDGNQKIAATIHNVSGSATIEIIQGEQVLMSRSGQANSERVVVLDMSDKWAARFSPGIPVSLRMTANGRTLNFSTCLHVKQAVIENPKMPNIGFSFGDGAITFTVPADFPVLRGAEMSISVPNAPVNFYIDYSGRIMFGLSFSTSPVSVPDKNYKAADPEKAKTANDEEVGHWFNEEVKKMQEEIDRVNRGMDAVKGEGGERPYSKEFKIKFTIAINGDGQLDTIRKDQKLNARFSLGVKASYTYTQYFVVGPAPAYISFGVSLNMGFAVKTEVSFVTDPSFAFKGLSNTTFEISMGIKVSLAGGVGIQNIMDLYLEGGAGIGGSLTFGKTTSPSKPFPHERGSAQAYVKAGYHLFFVSGSVTLVNKAWLMMDNWEDPKTLPREIDPSSAFLANTETSAKELNAMLDSIAVGVADDDGLLAYTADQPLGAAGSADLVGFAMTDYGVYQEPTDPNDLLTIPAQTVAGAPLGEITPSKITKLVNESYADNKVDQLLLNGQKVLFYLASVKHSDGESRISLVWNVINGDGTLATDSKKCGVITGFKGHVTDYDLSSTLDSSEGIIEIALTYRESLSSDNRHMELFYARMSFNNNGGSLKCEQLPQFNKLLDTGSRYWGTDYYLSMPRVAHTTGMGMVSVLMMADSYYQGPYTLRANKPHIYYFTLSSETKGGSMVWSDRQEYAVIDMPITDIRLQNVYDDSASNFHDTVLIMTLINQDQSARTKNNQEMTLTVYNAKEKKWYDRSLTDQGDIHGLNHIKLNSYYGFLYAKGNHIYTIRTQIWRPGKLVIEDAKTEIATRDFDFCIAESGDGGRYRGYISWVDNDRKSSNANLFPKIMAIRVDLENTGRSLGLFCSSAFVFANLPERIDNHQLSINGNGTSDIIYTSAKKFGGVTGDLYYCSMPQVAAVRIDSIAPEKTTLSVNEPLVLYVKMTNIGNQYLYSINLEVANYEKFIAASKVFYLNKKDSIVPTVNDIDPAILALGELVDLSTVEIMPSAPKGEYYLSPGETRTYRFTFNLRNLDRYCGTVKLAFKMHGVSPIDSYKMNSGEDAPVMVSRAQQVSEFTLGNPDVGVQASLHQINGETWVHILVDNENDTKTNMKLTIDGVTTGLTRSTLTPLLRSTITSLTDGSERDTGTKGQIQNSSGVGSMNIDMPLANLLNGTTPDQLVISIGDVMIPGVGLIEDYSDWDNSVTLNINSAKWFVITQDITDAVTFVDGQVHFETAAEGGYEPYTWQWQMKVGRNGTWQDLSDRLDSIDGAHTARLTLSHAQKTWMDRFYRCVVTDNAGLSIFTSEAGIRVQDVPPITGDTAPLALWIILGVCSLSALAVLWLSRKKRHSRG